MSLNGISMNIFEQEKEFISKIADTIIAGGSNMQWVNDQVKYRIVSQESFIESDIFGDLGEFKEEYPHASYLTKANILKMFITGLSTGNKEDYFENGIQYRVSDITAGLKSFIRTYQDFFQALEVALFRERAARRIPHDLDMDFDKLRRVSAGICMLVILYKIRFYLDQSQEADEALEKWLLVSKQALFQKTFEDPLEPRFQETIERPLRPYVQWAVTDWRSFFEHERQNFREYVAAFKRIFVRQPETDNNSRFPRLFLTLVKHQKLSQDSFFYLMKLVGIPFRIFVNLSKIITNHCGKVFAKLLSFFINSNSEHSKRLEKAFLAVTTFSLLLLSAYFLVTLSLMSFAGIQFFPLRATYLLMSLAFSVHALMGTSVPLFFAGIDIVKNLVTTVWPFFGKKEMVLTNVQRRSLMLSLYQELNKELDPNNKKIMSQELAKLSNPNVPYILSNFDKVLIAREGRESEFGLPVTKKKLERSSDLNSDNSERIAQKSEILIEADSPPNYSSAFNIFIAKERNCISANTDMGQEKNTHSLSNRV